MARCTEIEWLFDECDAITDQQRLSSTDLTSMTIAEELIEIITPITHPIGATSIQIIGISAVYDCVIKVQHPTGSMIRDINGDRCLSLTIILLVFFAYVCVRFKLPRYVLWLPLMLLALAAWLIVEWSLFQ